MINKKLFLIFLGSILLSLLFSNFVSADNCCANTISETCYAASSQSECAGAEKTFYAGDNCAVVSDCEMGCCCGAFEQEGRFRFMCPASDTFVLDPMQSIGASCSCGGNTYSITGTITDASNTFISNAIVSAGGESTTSSNVDGSYTLVNVPEGPNVLVAADSTGCLPNSVTTNLDSDKTGVDIQLNCVCAPGNCNITLNTYCETDNTWSLQKDLTVPAQKTDYCNHCGMVDPIADCGIQDSCVDNDRACPVGCTSATDSDCVCSMTSNGVCPSHCTESNDVDCVPVADCGDGFVTYPYETCELGQPGFCSDDDCVDCNCESLTGCGNLIVEEGEQCEIGMLCLDGSVCDNCICGDAPCSGAALNPTATASFDTQTRSILIQWTPSASCPPANFHVFECKKGGSETCSDIQTSSFTKITPLLLSTLNWTDSLSVLENSEYCYYVKAFYGSDQGNSGIVCQQTGDAFCMESHPAEFCRPGDIRSQCDSDNNIVPIEACSGNSKCMGPTGAGITFCSAAGVCNLCNGLYGMFSNLELRVRGDDGIPRFCHYRSGAYVVEGCYLDRTKTLFSAFDYCANIESCYDYKSETACKDQRDPCQKNQGCEWAWMDNSIQELGGICRPVNAELQQCQICDEKIYNWLSPGCTSDVCSLFGTQCNYQGSGSTDTCSKQSIVTCENYLGAEDCVGGRRVSVDAIYDADGNRTGGTHQLTPSLDNFNLGKCYWVVGNGWCPRNADNYPENNAGIYGEDCSSTDNTCKSDFESPVTSILRKCSGFGSVFGDCPANVRIAYSVSDNIYLGDNVNNNVYSGDNIDTYFCITPASQDCYPTTIPTQAGLFETTISTSGDYVIKYYSQDFAKNLEIVKSENIKVDAMPPQIEITWPPTEENFPTNQNSVVMQGVVDLDTIRLCTYAEGSSLTNCIYPCGVYSGVDQTHCISNSSGGFNITVTIPPVNALYNIWFDAEDVVGNQMIGVSLLAIYRNDTLPQGPIIIIT